MSKAANTISTVDKACRLLKEAAGMGVFSLSEMARALDEPTSSVDRLINTLASHKFLERVGDGWQIGIDAARLWSSYRLTKKNIIAQAQQGLTKTEIPGEA